MTSSDTNWTGVFFGLLLSSFAAYQMFKLPPAMPFLLERYGYDRALAGGFMSVYALIGLLFSLPIGRLIARRGTYALVPPALVLMILGNVLGLVVPESGLVVLAARAMEGLSFAVLAIIGPVLANTHASPRHLPLVIGMTAAWIPVGQITATLLALAAFRFQGWQSLWVAAILGSLALIYWARILARGSSPPVSGEAKPKPTTQTGSALSAWERLGLLFAAGIFMLWSGQYFAYMTWLPQYLVEVHGATLLTAQLGYSLPVSMLIVFCLVTGLLLRWGVPLTLLLPLALVSQAAVWWLIPVTGGGWPGLLSLTVYGIGAGITPTCLFAMPSAILGHGRAAAPAFAFIMTGRNIGVFAGPILLAQAFKMTGGWDAGIPIFGSISTAGLVLATVLVVHLLRARPAA